MAGPSYRFGPFLIDRAGYRALRGTDPVDLTPKLLDLLLHLLDHAGTLVTKEQLLDALWPGANVTENALTQAVSELRDALGDDAGAPRYIKTVARRGYRFIAQAEAVEPPRSVRVEPSRASFPDRADAIAVMDFVNVTGDPESAWLSAGIAETVTGDLRALDHFRVVDRGRVIEAVRGTDGSLQQVVNALGARLAVVGSYQRNGPRVRITARVVNVASGEALADAKVDGPLDGIFDLQDQVVAQFSQELGVPGGRSGAGTRDTPSLQAYRAFTEGSLRLETLDVREMPQAIVDFERAVTTDPRYALAHAGLASAELALYEATRSDNEPAGHLLERAVEHARHAVQLDDSLAEAHATLALVLVSAWQTAEAAGAARRAVSIEPSNWRHLFRLGHATWGDQRLRAASSMLALYPDFAFAHFQIGMVHVARGHLTEAETVLRQGAAVQDRQIGRGGRYPALGLHWMLGLVRLALDDVDEALAEFDRESRLAEPHRLYGREYAMNALSGRGAAQLRAKRAGEAIESFRRALDLYPNHAPSHLGLAVALRQTGSASAAAIASERAQSSLPILERTQAIEAARVRALLLASQGRHAEAAETLATLLENAPPGFACWTIPVEPFLAQLSGSKEFVTVHERLAERAR
jgi:DNA-binding winged helix-turn-helix (wHTH) protein/tetratricopeptide (TPR) repeat protein